MRLFLDEAGNTGGILDKMKNSIMEHNAISVWQLLLLMIAKVNSCFVRNMQHLRADLQLRKN